MTLYDGTNAPTIAVQFLKSGVWTDVDANDILSIDTDRGRIKPQDDIPSGTCTVVVNNTSGIYDPDNTTASTWVVTGVSILRAGLQCRVVATWAATAYVLYMGYLDNPIVNQGNQPSVTFRFYDGLYLISRAYAPVLTAAQVTAYTGETSSARAARMLDLAGWPTGAARSLAGSITMNSDKQDRPAIQMIRECSRVEAGAFYMSRTNVATLEALSAKFTKPTALAFSDTGVANTVKYGAISTTSGVDQLVNDVTIFRNPSKTYKASFDSSVTAYGKKSVTIPAPASSDANAANLALLYGRQWADPQTRITSITFDGMRLSTLYPDMLSMELLNLCSVARVTKDGRSLSWNLVIEGIKHSITPRAWKVTLRTSPINPYTITI